MNKYETEVWKVLDKYNKDEQEMYESSQYGLWPEAGALRINPYKNLINRLTELLKQDLEYYEYFPDYLQKDENIINAYHSCYSTNFINDEAYGKLYDLYEKQIKNCWNYYHLSEKINEKLDLVDQTYIPDDVETGYVEETEEKEEFNRYQREIKLDLDIYYEELTDPSKKIPNAEGKIYSPYDALVNKVCVLLIEDLEYYENLPEFLQFDKKVIDMYATLMNSTYDRYICNVKVAVKYWDEINKCFEQYQNGEFKSDILTYIPDEVETGIRR